MARKSNPFLVDPRTVRLPVVIENADGEHWIEILHELPVSAKKRIEASGLRYSANRDITPGMSPEEIEQAVSMRIDSGAVLLEKVYSYLKDWSFTGYDDKRLPITKDVLGKLKEPVFNAINKAIDEYRVQFDPMSRPLRAEPNPATDPPKDEEPESSEQTEQPTNPEPSPS